MVARLATRNPGPGEIAYFHRTNYKHDPNFWDDMQARWIFQPNTERGAR